MKSAWALIFGITLALSSFHTFAQEAVDIGEIEVKDKKADKIPKADETAAAAVVNPKDTEELTESVADLIEQSPGVYIKRYGGLDDFSAISLRGSPASQVQIYLDDVPLATSQGEPTDLSIIPTEIIDRVEVYRGGSPGIMPDSAASGVIIIRTKTRPQKTETVFNNTGASFGTYKGTVSRSQSFKDFSYTAAFERSQSDGDFTYKNNNGTIYNTADDYEATRQNNNFAINDLYTKLFFELGSNSTLSFSNILFQKEQGIPGLGSYQSANAHLQMWRDLVIANFDKKFASVSGLNFHASAFFDFLNSQFRDPNGEIGLGVEDNDDNTYRFGFNFSSNYALGSTQILKGFVAQRSEFYLPMNRAANPPTGPQSLRQTVNFGIEDEAHFFSDRLTIVPAFRLSNIFNNMTNQDPSVQAATVVKNTRTDNQISAKLGLAARLVDQLSFKGNLYRGFRNPTFSELFGDRGTIVGNPTLSPEKTINFDVGLAYSFNTDSNVSLSAEGTYFRSYLTDLIQYILTSQYTIKARNFGKATIQGAEFAAKFNIRDKFNTYLSYTFQDAKDTSLSPSTNGKYLPGRPKNELTAGATWRKDWLSWFATKLFGDINFMSGNYLDTQNLFYVERRTLLELGAAVVFCKTIEMSFNVKNLLNEQIVDIVGYPLPGRSYWGILSVRI